MVAWRSSGGSTSEKAERVAMADLRALVEELGYTDLRTLLNSGNVVFTVPAASRKVKAHGDAGTRIEEAMSARLGVSARVIVLTAAERAGSAKPRRGRSETRARRGTGRR